jgi:hypothetical protein
VRVDAVVEQVLQALPEKVLFVGRRLFHMKVQVRLVGWLSDGARAAAYGKHDIIDGHT